MTVVARLRALLLAWTDYRIDDVVTGTVSKVGGLVGIGFGMMEGDF